MQGVTAVVRGISGQSLPRVMSWSASMEFQRIPCRAPRPNSKANVRSSQAVPTRAAEGPGCADPPGLPEEAQARSARGSGRTTLEGAPGSWSAPTLLTRLTTIHQPIR